MVDGKSEMKRLSPEQIVRGKEILEGLKEILEGLKAKYPLKRDEVIMNDREVTSEEIAIAEDRPEELGIVFRFSTSPTDKVTEYDDLAEEYIVVRDEEAVSNLIVWGRFNGRWIANPSGRPVIRELLRRFGISI
jgi:hypothetical protein